MRKLLLTILCIFLLCGCVFAQSAQISELNTRIQVDPNGVRHVTATAVIEFTDPTTSFLFPLGEDAEDIMVTGGSYEIETVNGVKCVLFTNELGFIGRQSFLCSYTLPCTMTESLDSQTFRIKVPERGWEYGINKYSLIVNFPVDISEFPVWESSYYGDEIDNYLRIQIKEGQVQAVSNSSFRDHETVTMSLQFPEDSFILRHLAERTVKVDRVVFFLLLLLCVGYWFLRLKGRIFYRKAEGTLSFLSSAGEIPCQINNELPDLGGLIAHWGNLGYIFLRRTKRGAFRLEKQMDMGNERSSAERRLFQSIFRTINYVDLSGLRFRNAVVTEAPVLRAHWRNRMFKGGMGRPRTLRFLATLSGLAVSVMIYDTLLPANPSRWFWLTLLTALSFPLYWLVQKAVRSWYAFGRWIFLGLGAVSAVILFLPARSAELGLYMFLTLLLQSFCSFVTRFGGKHTPAGDETVGELMNFSRYIAHVKEEDARLILRRDPQYFYRALPYAEILGMDKRFVKYFGGSCTESCPWILDERKDSVGAKEFYEIYKELLVQLRIRNAMQALQSRFGRKPHVPGSRPTSGRETTARPRPTASTSRRS